MIIRLKRVYDFPFLEGVRGELEELKTGYSQNLTLTQFFRACIRLNQFASLSRIHDMCAGLTCTCSLEMCPSLSHLDIQLRMPGDRQD